jgi:pilus assembly protein CpaE
MKIKMGKSMCFFSAKGGVGKTTNILNLAGIFEQLNKRTLVIDMDLYSGAVATYLNKKSDKNVYTLFFDMINGTYKDFSKYVSRIDDYIDILPAPKDPRDANKVDSRYIKNIIDEAKMNYDVVLIDTNHALNDVNLSVLENVDEIVFFTTNDPLDLKNIRSILTIFDSLEFNNYYVLLNNSRDPFKNYLTLYDMKRIINHNINYSLSTDLFLKDMEKLVMKGVIVSLDRKFADVMPNDYKTFVLMATTLLEEDE